MVDWTILKQKAEVVVLVISLAAMLNGFGYYFKRLETTALTTVLVMLIIWVWTHDAKLSELEENLNKKLLMRKRSKK